MLIGASWRALKRYRNAIGLLFWFVMAAVWGSVYSQIILNQQLPESLIKQDIWIQGTVKDLPQQRAHALRFTFKLDSSQPNLEGFHSDILLNWYDKPYPDLKAGQRWRIKARLKPAHGSLNIGGFDYEKWLFSKSVRATGYVRETELAVLLSPATSWYFFESARSDIKQFVESENLPFSGIIKALAIAERSDISDVQWQVFRDTGTAHLIAISGLHIGLIAGIAYFLGQFLWRHTLLVRTQYPAQHIGRFTALIAALIYAALAGFTLPTLRALLMLLAYFALQGLRRNPRVFFSLGVVLCWVLVLDPLAPLGAGFWLSFCAVAAIAYIIAPAKKVDIERDYEIEPLKLKEKISRWFVASWRVQWAVFIALIPLLLLFFGQISIISLLANLIAIPLLGMVVVPLVLLAMVFLGLGAPSIASELLTLSDALIGLIWPMLNSLASWPYAIWQTAMPSLWALGLSFVGVLILLSPKLGKIKWLGALAFIPLFYSVDTPRRAAEFEVNVLDVGQGLAVLVQTQHHALLYDAGIKYEQGFDSGEAIVLPVMRQQPIKQLDVAIASHENRDHYGGLPAVLKRYPDAEIFSPAAFYANSKVCRHGLQWQWGEVTFAFLSPKPGNLETDNNASCVLKISSAFGSVLLTGDIEKELERVLTNALDADVLIVPHHGSKTSSTRPFIKAVSPTLAVFSAGWLNRFSHPHPTVVARYQAQNIQRLNTADTGQIQILFKQQGISAVPLRAIKPAYWRTDDAALTPVVFTPN